MADPALLHIYSPNFSHGDATIIGNTAGIEALRNACEQVLDENRLNKPIKCLDGELLLGSSECYTADGEGFTLQVILNNHEWNHNSWTQLELPYTDREMHPKRKDSIDLFDLIGKEAYETSYKNANKG